MPESTAPSRRPRILLNFAATVDGKIHPAPGHRKGPFVLSRGPEDHKRMRILRQQADAILIGASNLRMDDPGLSLEPAERERKRAANEPLPSRIVITHRGDGVDPRARMFDPSIGGPSYVVHAGVMPADVREQLGKVARLVELGPTTVPIERLLIWMKDELGAETVLCEGGGVLVAGLFGARAVDELYLTLVPRVLGGALAPTLAAGPGFGLDEIPDPKLTSVERVGDELYLRYDFYWQ
jgi:5-amino-6-(5-phosphoribosylamino)uracil reductase